MMYLTIEIYANQLVNHLIIMSEVGKNYEKDSHLSLFHALNKC